MFFHSPNKNFNLSRAAGQWICQALIFDFIAKMVYVHYYLRIKYSKSLNIKADR